MENHYYPSSYSPTNYRVRGLAAGEGGGGPPSPTRFFDSSTMFLSHHHHRPEPAAALRYHSAAAADFDINPPGVASRIPSSASSSLFSHPTSWSSAFAAANAAAPALDLKRSADALYHPTILGTLGQSEAWYSTNSLAKRHRYESGSNMSMYPQRPGEKDCAHYMLTRTCKYGENCKFDHPIWVPEGGIPDWKEVPNTITSETPPERPGEPDCPYFLKTQKCKFGSRCKFNHPKVSSENADVSSLPERPLEPPCAFYMKSGKCKFGAACKFHHPKDIKIQVSDESSHTVEQTQANPMLVGAMGDTQPIKPLISPLLHNSKGLPVRLGEVDCPFYMKTGSCKYGATCRYSHPDNNVNPSIAALGSSVVASTATNLNIGALNPALSVYQAYEPRLSNPMSQVGIAGTIYPQRPGQIECDFYMKTGECKFGEKCKYHHPIDRSAPSLSKQASQQTVKLTPAGLPRREGAALCPYYLKTGTCKFGATCKFDHPPPGEVMEMAKSQGTSMNVGGEAESNENMPGSAPEQQ